MTSGTLYIVATPIGNLADITFRAVEILREVACIACEDTRHSKFLLQHYAITTPTIALHEHNEQERHQELIRQLLEGKNIALISDAGTPLISDPGYRLVSVALENVIKVVPIPGACALIAALSAAGLPSDRFCFEGFLPAKTTARQKQLLKLRDETRTLIFYEAPHRIIDTLTDMTKVLGSNRIATIARELTKTFETIKKAPLHELLAWVTSDPNQQKGEFVILLQGQELSTITKDFAITRVLEVLLAELPVKQACKLAAQITDEKPNSLYELALRLKKHDNNSS